MFFFITIPSFFGRTYSCFAMLHGITSNRGPPVLRLNRRHRAEQVQQRTKPAAGSAHGLGLCQQTTG